MDTQSTIGSLNLFTLVVIFFIAVAGFLWFLRKRSNREGLNGRGMTTNLDEQAAKIEDKPRARDQR